MRLRRSCPEPGRRVDLRSHVGFALDTTHAWLGRPAAVGRSAFPDTIVRTAVTPTMDMATNRNFAKTHC